MTCLRCQHESTVKAGITKANTPRFRCKACGAKFSAPKAQPLGYHRTSVEDAVRIVTLLVEGMSIRATARATGIDKDTISALLLTLGAKAATLFNDRVRNLKSERLQCDELWCFTYCKERALKLKPSIREKHPDAGDTWTWTAIDADTKLIVSFLVGERQPEAAQSFMSDVASRLANRVQLTTDAFRQYLTAVERAFGMDIDYAQLHKIYSAEQTGKYSPPVCIGVERRTIMGDPDPSKISTSYIERHNLTVRMSLRRFTRLTNGFTKKRIYLEAAVALFMTYYNFCRVHQTLRVTPAMAAGLTDTVWSIADLLTYESAEQKAA